MTETELLQATYEARIAIIRDYLAGERDHQALNGAMVRLLLASLESELMRTLPLSALARPIEQRPGQR